MSAIFGLRDGVSATVPYSPVKEKATTRGVYHSRSPPMRLRHLLSGARVKLLLAACMAFATLLIAGRIGSIMGWNPSPSSSVSSPSRFDLNEEDNLNNRFKPIKDLRTDAIFSVDDDVIVRCSTLDFAFTVWQSASDTMVGFVPRMHWLDKEMAWHTTDMVIGGQCGGWVLTVWWSPKQHFFIGSTWICTPIRCPHLFMIM